MAQLRDAPVLSRQILNPSIKLAIQLAIGGPPALHVRMGANVHGSPQERVDSTEDSQHLAVVGEAAEVFRSVDDGLGAVGPAEGARLHGLIAREEVIPGRKGSSAFLLV